MSLKEKRWRDLTWESYWI